MIEVKRQIVDFTDKEKYPYQDTYEEDLAHYRELDRTGKPYLISRLVKSQTMRYVNFKVDDYKVDEHTISANLKKERDDVYSTGVDDDFSGEEEKIINLRDLYVDILGLLDWFTERFKEEKPMLADIEEHIQDRLDRFIQENKKILDYIKGWKQTFGTHLNKKEPVLKALEIILPFNPLITDTDDLLKIEDLLEHTQRLIQRLSQELRDFDTTNNSNFPHMFEKYLFEANNRALNIRELYDDFMKLYIKKKELATSNTYDSEKDYAHQI